ncbi:hypothetical protein, partial [Vibrio jasicida]|uniref:hypothetical protein n=1 Tax=Vibrio jasicida TaxID=766224 RepID=UPI001CA5C5A3
LPDSISNNHLKVIFPRTLECARLLSFLENENKQLVFVLKTNIENFTSNLKDYFVSFPNC